MWTSSVVWTHAMVYLLVMWYWPMGSASAPDMAGPTMYPIPHAAPTIVIPRAWLLSFDVSDITALQAEIKPGTKIIFSCA